MPVGVNLTDEARRAYKQRWYLANRERILAKARERQAERRDEIAAYQKAYRERDIEASREQSRRWKEANRERHRASSRAYGAAHRDAISAKRKAARRAMKQSVLDAYGGTCACCGEATFEFLTLDHVNGDGAAHRKVHGPGRSDKVYAELIGAGFPAGYRVLCFNCNSARGFYGYCPHRPDDLTGVPPGRRLVAAPGATQSVPAP